MKITARLEHVRRRPDRREPVERRQAFVPASRRRIRDSLKPLKLSPAVTDVLVDIAAEFNGAVKDIAGDNRRMKASLEKLLALGELTTVCDSASVREFALAGLGRKP